MPRRARRTVAMALCACVVLLAPAASQAAGPAGFFGVVPQADPAVRDYDRMRAGNVGSIRFGVNWSAVNPARGDYRWSGLDARIGRAAQAGIPVLPFVKNTPSWVSSDPDRPPLATRAQRRAFKTFMTELVARYGRGGDFWRTYAGTPLPVKVWQIWNEPSSPAHWEPSPSATDYAALVKLAESAIHTADSRAKIMLAGLFYSPSTETETGPKAPDFLRDVLSVRGMKAITDYVAIHPYGKKIDHVKFQLQAFRQALKDRNADEIPMFVTEIGWAGVDDPAITGSLVKTEAGQARMLRQAFDLALAKRKRWNIGGVHWFSLVDVKPSADYCRFCPWTGLFRRDRTPKPAWQAFKSYTEVG